MKLRSQVSITLPSVAADSNRSLQTDGIHMLWVRQAFMSIPDHLFIRYDALRLTAATIKAGPSPFEYNLTDLKQLTGD